MPEKAGSVMDTEYLNKVVRFKAVQMSRQKGFRKDEWEDIRQELWLHVWKAIEKFDPSRSCEHTFVVRIVEHKAASIIRHRRAAMRNPDREELSLQEEIRDGDGKQVRRSETTVELGRSPWPRTDTAHDLNAAINELPPDDREAIERLRMGESIPKWQRLSIKKYLEDKGLDKYLE